MNIENAAPSPEVIKALAELVKSSCSPGTVDHGLFQTPEGLKAIAEVISAVAWPLVVLAIAWILLPQLRDILSRLTEFEAFGVKAKIDDKLKQSAEAAIQRGGRNDAPTQDEVLRSYQVEGLIDEANPNILLSQIDALAREYEETRSSMPSGDARTQAMEVVMAKMRTLGRAAYALRTELSKSRSPGRRLMAIACLQMIPDFDMLEWLVERVERETPFVSYHALVALNSAVSSTSSVAHLPALQSTRQALRSVEGAFDGDSDRQQQLREFVKLIARLEQASSIS